MATQKTQKPHMPLIVHDGRECYRLVSQQASASVELNRHPLPAPLGLSYVVDGLDVVLHVSDDVGTMLQGAAVTVSVDVADPDTGADWRVVLVGSAQLVDGTVRVHPASVVGYRVGEESPEVICLG